MFTFAMQRVCTWRWYNALCPTFTTHAGAKSKLPREYSITVRLSDLVNYTHFSVLNKQLRQT